MVNKLIVKGVLIYGLSFLWSLEYADCILRKSARFPLKKGVWHLIASERETLTVEL